MNRLGLLLLLIFSLVLLGFVLLVREGGDGPAVDPATAPVEAVTVAPSGLAIPVVGKTAIDLVDTFADARGTGRVHDAIDIMAPRGTPVVAAAAGTVEKLFDSRDGGRTLYVRSPDARYSYYYAHLDGYAPGIAEGVQVTRGQRIAQVGFTGNASPEGPHLHFAIHAMAAGEPWHGGRALNPYPVLAGN